MDICILLCVGSFVLGFLIGWLFFKHKLSGICVLSEERQRLLSEKEDELKRLKEELMSEKLNTKEAVTKLEAAQKSLEEQKQLLETMKNELRDTFNSLSLAALKSNSEDFLKLATQYIERVMEVTKGKLGEHEATMNSLIKPLQETLKKYEDQLIQIESERKKMFGSLEEQLRFINLSHQTLQKETNNLVSALRKPQVRGRWGEMQLMRVVELSGMNQYCDVSIQSTKDSEKGMLRPDMVVHLPSKKEIVVDSKVSLEAYLDGIYAETEEEKRSHFQRHAQQIKNHIKQLSSKEYWAQFENSPEFVVLFIPGEVFLNAALEVDAGLLEYAMEKKVIITTPTSFIALLKVIASIWQQENMTKNAQKIRALAKEIHDRIGTTLKYLEELGVSIKRATENYNRAIGSLESRVLPSLRKFKDLGVPVSEDVPFLDDITVYPRIKNNGEEKL